MMLAASTAMGSEGSGPPGDVRRRARRTPAILFAVTVLLAVCCTGVLGLVFPTTAQAAGWQVQQLTHNTFDDRFPSISGNRVVWQVIEPSDSEIMLRDLGTGEFVRLTDNTAGDSYPAVSRHHVVWNRMEGGIWRVVLWDAELNTRGTIGDGLSPHVDGDFVVWASGSGGKGEIYLHRISSGTTTPISSTATLDFSPRVSKRIVVWHGIGGSDQDIYRYHIPSGQMSAVTQDSTIDRPPDTDGFSVVWGRHDGSDDEIMMGSGWPLIVLPLTNNAEDDREPVVSGRRVAWKQMVGFSHANVRVRDLQSGATSTLTAAPVQYLCDVEIDGPRVVWCAHDGTDMEVYLASYTSFSDVAATHFNYLAIQSLADEGVIGGYADGTFRPENPVLRAQFAKMIVGALGIPVDESLVPPFGDLGPDDPTTLYPHDYIAAAAQQGITNGKTPTTFDPWGEITRAQVVTMVIRGVQLWWGVPTPALPLGYTGTFGDFDPTHGYNMKLAEYLGLMEHVGGFGPQWNPWAPASRAELSQILWEATDRLKP